MLYVLMLLCIMCHTVKPHKHTIPSTSSSVSESPQGLYRLVPISAVFAPLTTPPGIFLPRNLSNLLQDLLRHRFHHS